MKKKKHKRMLRTLGLIFIGFCLLFIFVPYLFPVSVSSPTTNLKPFENSAVEVVNGTYFHYRTYNTANIALKGKLLFVHGLAGSTYSFEKVAPLIAEHGYFVISVDLPGFGYSDRTPKYVHSQSNRAKDLWQLLSIIDQQLESNLASIPWILAGHSMGGGTVAAMALQNENRTKRVIFIDAALFETSHGGSIIGIPPLNQWMQVALEHFLITEKGIKNLLTSAYGVEPSPEQIEGYLAPLRLPGTARSLVSIVRTSKNEEIERLKGLSIPKFAIWGSNDTWVPEKELEKLKEIYPDIAVCIINGAAHCPMETHSDVFVEALLQWLSSY